MFMSSALAMPADWWAWEALAGTQALHNYLWFGGEVNNHNSLASWQSSIQGFWARASHLAIASEGCSSKQSKAVALWASATVLLLRFDWSYGQAQTLGASSRWQSLQAAKCLMTRCCHSCYCSDSESVWKSDRQCWLLFFSCENNLWKCMSRKSKTDKSSTHKLAESFGTAFWLVLEKIRKRNKLQLLACSKSHYHRLLPT